VSDFADLDQAVSTRDHLKRARDEGVLLTVFGVLTCCFRNGVTIL
jgi:hypothetical protein